MELPELPDPTVIFCEHVPGMDWYTPDQLRAYAEEAVKQEREAILAAIDDLEEPAWHGYENPYRFDDGKSAAMAAIRART